MGKNVYASHDPERGHDDKAPAHGKITARIVKDSKSNTRKAGVDSVSVPRSPKYGVYKGIKRKGQ